MKKVVNLDGFNKGLFQKCSKSSKMTKSDQYEQKSVKKCQKVPKMAKKGQKSVKMTKSEKTDLLRGLLAWGRSPKWLLFEQFWTKWQKQMVLIRDFKTIKKVTKMTKMTKKWHKFCSLLNIFEKKISLFSFFEKWTFWKIFFKKFSKMTDFGRPRKITFFHFWTNWQKHMGFNLCFFNNFQKFKTVLFWGHFGRAKIPQIFVRFLFVFFQKCPKFCSFLFIFFQKFSKSFKKFKNEKMSFFFVFFTFFHFFQNFKNDKKWKNEIQKVTIEYDFLGSHPDGVLVFWDFSSRFWSTQPDSPGFCHLGGGSSCDRARCAGCVCVITGIV